MNAINLFRRSGLTTAQIASQLECTRHLIRYYERGQRFPTKKLYERMVALAAQRGISLSAKDFLLAGEG